MIARLLVATLLASTASAAALPQVPAGNSAPQPVPFTTTIPEPQDVTYPGTIELAVDATNTAQGIFTAHETIPVAKAGPMVLLYPQWHPGNHSPTGQIEKLAGLVIHANGKLVPWARDPADMYAFHIDVPQGARTIAIDLQFLSATKSDQGAVVMGRDMLRVQWNAVSLYPAGYFTRDIPISATVKYPQGFIAASGLPSRANGANYAYQTTNYEVLVDSPTLAGRYYKAIALSPRVMLDIFADNAEQLAATPAQLDAHKRLVDQTVKTFAAQHYDNYHFLFGISDEIGGIGLEHHRSSEDGVGLGYFVKWDDKTGARNLLPHEYTHSWDGKFRRGADLWTPNFNVPMRNLLLWVYEGQTQFWGYVLQARSGLVSKEDTLDQYASIMAYYDTAPARQWRDLIDTTNDPIISQRRPKGWTSWERSEDYYNEGLLVWMDVDSLLREKSGGTKSIDDFARAFFGMRDGDYGELTYTVDDVAATLNGIVPYDWAGYLHQRLTEHASGAPIQGFARNGYRLIYTDTQAKTFKQNEKAGKIVDLTYSGGFSVNESGEITSVFWNGAAFKAGLAVGTTIVTVGDMAFKNERLTAAITAAKTEKAPMTMTVRSGDVYRTVAIDWHQGLRYPHLEKIGTADGGLDRLLAPRP